MIKYDVRCFTENLNILQKCKASLKVDILASDIVFVQ